MRSPSDGAAASAAGSEAVASAASGADFSAARSSTASNRTGSGGASALTTRIGPRLSARRWIVEWVITCGRTQNMSPA